MGTIAEKLTYLNNTKGLLKDNINLTGAGLTNQTPFRQYATDLKTALLNILNNGIDTLYNNFPKTTGTGTNITLNNTLQAPIRSVINGDTQQDGEPTPDNPKEIKSVTGLQKVKVEGKNLFDKNNTPNFVDNGCTYEIIDTGIRAKLTSTSDGVKHIRYIVKKITGLENQKITAYAKVKPSENQNTRFIIGTCNNTGGNRNILAQSTIINSETTQAITGTIPSTLDSTNEYLYVLLYATTSIGVASGVYTDFEDLMIVLGEYTTSDIGEYEPYQSQEYEINLGKQLFDKNNTTLGRIDTSGVVATISGYYTSDFIKVEPNTTYTKNSPTSDAYHRFAFYSSNDTSTFISTSNNNTIITPSNCNYLRFCGIDTEVNTAQLEKGQATSYSPYFTPIHLYENDQIIGTPNNWSIKHIMGEVVLDGSEYWVLSGTNTSGYNRFTSGIIYNLINKPSTTSQVANILSNYFIKKSADNTYQRQDGISVGTNGNLYIYGDDLKEYTADQFKTWLSTHNTKVVYELAEPTTEPITNTELIEDLNNFYNKAKSYNGQTNISVDGDLQMILDVSAIIGD